MLDFLFQMGYILRFSRYLAGGVVQLQIDG